MTLATEIKRGYRRRRKCFEKEAGCAGAVRETVTYRRNDVLPGWACILVAYGGALLWRRLIDEI